MNEGSMFVHARLDLLHAIKLEAHKLKTTLYMARELYVITSMADYAPHWEARLTIGCVVMCSGAEHESTGEGSYLSSDPPRDPRRICLPGHEQIPIANVLLSIGSSSR